MILHYVDQWNIADIPTVHSSVIEMICRSGLYINPVRPTENRMILMPVIAMHSTLPDCLPDNAEGNFKYRYQKENIYTKQQSDCSNSSPDMFTLLLFFFFAQGAFR